MPAGDPHPDRPRQSWRMDGPFHFTTTSVARTEGVAGPESTVELGYRLNEISFTERVTLPFALPDTARVRAAVRVLHLVAGVSYYKMAAPTALHLDHLGESERDLVLALYDRGLREMAYRNAMAVPLPVDLVVAAAPSTTPYGPDGSDDPDDAAAPPDDLAERRVLIPVGGGKDSALVASLIPHGDLLAVNPVGAQRHLAEALGRPLLAVTRTMDPALRDLVARGVQNGHVPVTAITSAISVLVAVALGHHDVVMGIERSADEPTVVTGEGVTVNHQFSKSTEAEQLMRAVFSPLGVNYFSLLRPLSELAIGAAVARRGLTGDIVSCNRVFTVWNENTSSREQRPCGQCAKCLFTALMLAPSTEPDEIARAYGGPLLDRVEHIEPVRELWSDEKPFDCVGERLETAAALVLLDRTPAWSDQAVVRALGDRAGALLEEASVEPEDFLDVGRLDGLPEPFRPLVAALAEDLAAVPGRTERA